MKESDPFSDPRNDTTKTEVGGVNEARISSLKEGCRRLRRFLQPEDFNRITAILVYGSTARGTATPESDVDMWVATKTGEQLGVSAMNTIAKIFQREVPGVELSIGTSNLEVNSGSTRLITQRGFRNGAQDTTWQFIYAVTPEDQAEINRILEETKRAIEDKG